MPEKHDDVLAIEDHGIIGNMQSAAMVGVNGTIDFFCFPDFDSPTIFAALLDAEKGGSFQITPQLADMRHKQMYLPDSNILLTRYLSPDGVAEVTDFMPVQDGKELSSYAHQIIRMVRVIKGEIHFKVRCAPRFDYARSVHAVCKEEHAICFRPESGGQPAIALHATVALEVEGEDAVAEFTLHCEETASFALGTLKEEEKDRQQELDAEKMEILFRDSAQFWRDWIGQSAYRGRWREMVNRSALALKLLFSKQHSALLAAATFGLPEKLGGSRNWDYRYVWLRDSAFSLYALVRLGFTSEVRAYTDWLRKNVSAGLESGEGDGPLRVLYRADGGQDLDEVELTHLAGYRGSKPVRIGNDAKDQLQLDIYGEVMDAVYLSNKYSPGIPKQGWRRVLQLMDWLGQNWEREDEGIWELRGGRRHLLHSRLMCWVAFDRVLRLADKRSLDGPIAEWRALRQRINDDILDNFWNEELQSFVQEKGTKIVDASMLLMPMMRFISPTDPQWLSTLERIEACLTQDALVFRYETGSDGLDGEEGSFTACSFWLIECLARAGQLDKARLLFDKMLGYANHLGLYSEQLGESGEHLGNFPQALTHLALISAATYLDRMLDGTKETWA